ncbi:hypothetical protein ABT337_33330 [Saccharopolyspora hirsuta]|nr:hypothetical protein [Saccharopolyspora hirsuta]
MLDVAADDGQYRHLRSARRQLDQVGDELIDDIDGLVTTATAA